MPHDRLILEATRQAYDRSERDAATMFVYVGTQNGQIVAYVRSLAEGIPDDATDIRRLLTVNPQV